MIDLSYHKPEKKDENDMPLIAKFWILAISSAFFAYIFLSAIVGESIF